MKLISHNAFILIICFGVIIGCNNIDNAKSEPKYSLIITDCIDDFGKIDFDCFENNIHELSMTGIEFLNEKNQKIILDSINKPKYIHTFSKYIGNAARELPYINELAEKYNTQINFYLLLPRKELKPLEKDIAYPLNYDSIIYDDNRYLKISEHINIIPYDKKDILKVKHLESEYSVIHGIRQIGEYPPTTYYITRYNRIAAITSIYDVNDATAKSFKKLLNDSIPNNENISDYELSKLGFYSRVPKLLEFINE